MCGGQASPLRWDQHSTSDARGSHEAASSNEYPATNSASSWQAVQQQFPGFLSQPLSGGCDSSNCVHCQPAQRSQSLACLVSATPPHKAVACVPASLHHHHPAPCWPLCALPKCQSAPDISRVTGPSGLGASADVGRESHQHPSSFVAYEPAAQQGEAADAQPSPEAQHGLSCPGCSCGWGHCSPRSLHSSAFVNRAHGGNDPLLPWRFEPGWADRSDPVPAAFAEVGTFSSAGDQSCKQDIVCGIDFASTGHLFATASVTKQVCIYTLVNGSSALEVGAPARPVAVHRLPSKLSAIAWVPHMQSCVTVGDYDGVLHEVDVASGHCIAEVDEHDGRRVLSVAHSRHLRGLCASTSEDRTCRLWAGGLASHAATVLRPDPGHAVCCADFCPDDANLLALASASGRVLVYDLRNAAQPLLATAGHGRAASYARFLGRRRLVSAGVDGQLVLWDLRTGLPLGAPDAAPGSSEPGACSTPPPQAGAGGVGSGSTRPGGWPTAGVGAPARTFHGHSNSKNFVGLAVHVGEDLVACGSECSRVFVYRTSWGAPLSTHCLQAAGPAACASPCLGRPAAGAGQQAWQQPEFVSAVAWQPPVGGLMGQGPLLVAGTSQGRIKALQLRLRPDVHA